ncbi:MAG: hypothetical protein BWY70_01880 [Bacteroidetes bacterium ADurb.Bin408]|nr:MAG: hypothetical protein BWY70_01880 [Bacteroidetes bacterium ADurb.Bin408]
MIQLEDTAKYKVGKVYPCKICGVKFVMMNTCTGSVLPVEINPSPALPFTKGEVAAARQLPGKPEGFGFDGSEVFDPAIHRSHLKYCKEPLLRAEQWKEIVEEMKAEFRKNKLQQIKLFSK